MEVLAHFDISTMQDRLYWCNSRDCETVYFLNGNLVDLATVTLDTDIDYTREDYLLGIEITNNTRKFLDK